MNLVFSFWTVRKSLLFFLLLFSFGSFGCSEAPKEATPLPTPSTLPLWGDIPHARPSCIRGIHLTSWFVGSTKQRKQFEKLLAETEMNTVVIDIKEIEGDIYIPGVKLDGRDVYKAAMPNIKEYLTFLKDRGVFTIARIVVFKDIKLAKLKPEWTVKSSVPLPKAVEHGFQKDVWVDNKGIPWADQYNPHVWKYNIDVAVRAAELGFQGIQFDYIRFPSDGKTKLCVYSKPHSAASKVKALSDFLEEAHKKLKPMGMEISIDVFGLAGSIDNDLGIGQRLSHLLDYVDVISPMMYPSHYAKGEYGIADPNSSPYETVYRSIKDTRELLKHSQVRLIPFLQDFSLGVRYTADHVKSQIQAARDLGINEWLFWNPSCRYTFEAFEPEHP
jgi:hypothetical protein